MRYKYNKLVREGTILFPTRTGAIPKILNVLIALIESVDAYILFAQFSQFLAHHDMLPTVVGIGRCSELEVGFLLEHQN